MWKPDEARERLAKKQIWKYKNLNSCSCGGEISEPKSLKYKNPHQTRSQGKVVAIWYMIKVNMISHLIQSANSWAWWGTLILVSNLWKSPTHVCLTQASFGQKDLGDGCTKKSNQGWGLGLGGSYGGIGKDQTLA